MIAVVINGKDEELDGPTSLVDFLESKGLAERRIAVARNGAVIRRDTYEGVVIESGDRIEIVLPVGGG